MFGMVTVDGQVYRYMGAEGHGADTTVTQKSVVVNPTNTIYRFEAGGIELDLQFTTPSVGLDSDIVKSSRPITHVTWTAKSLDGKDHKVQVYYDNSAEGTVNDDKQEVYWTRPLPLPSTPQPVTSKADYNLKPGTCDIARFTVDAGRCAELCSLHQDCAAFVTDSDSCYLKSCGTVDDVVQETGYTTSFQSGSKGATNMTVMQVGASAQNPLGQTSDSINWGWSLVSAPPQGGQHSAMASDTSCRTAFASAQYFTLADDTSGPRGASDKWPVVSLAWDLGTVGSQSASRHAVLSYDQYQSQRFFGTDMEPLWRKSWGSAVDLLAAAEDAREQDLAETAAFDKELIANVTAKGGNKYATLLSLVYRQVVGGTQAVWNPILKEPWVFMKEISSDGDVSTVDVVYPAFPMFQYLYPEYFRKLMMPILVYGNNETKIYGQDIPYNLAWAPHHLGTWPVCDLIPSKQEQMPVEESGNMLIMLAALYKEQGDMAYLTKYFPMLDSWADYIVGSLPDPGNQLCTDDFEGPSPHNTNLAAKGIVALDAYAHMVEARGDKAKADKYRGYAASFVANWTQAAADGDHYRIQFNLPNTWSQKYNMLYQRVLGLTTFPDSVIDAEEAFYQTKMETCGVPLDNRHPYTKSDWSLWSASMGTQQQFQAIVDALYHFANVTTSRVPLTDWYDVEKCTQQGFRARPVQGGLFAKMLVPMKMEVEYI